MSWRVAPGVNNLQKVVISHPSGSTAEVYLNGGQVTSWKTPDKIERLYLSSAAHFSEGKPIRGGIPVVFPQFADSGPLVKHGWLRTTVWKVDDTIPMSANCVQLLTSDTPQTREVWDFPYQAALSVELGESDLCVTLRITNTGGREMSFTSALHTYLAVADITQASVLGLYGSPYIDKTAGRATAVDAERALRISEETDRIYTGAPWRIELSEADSRIMVSESGFRDVVVWNPWIELAVKLADMRPEDYLRFICIEAAVADEPLILGPGDSWSGSQRLTALP